MDSGVCQELAMARVLRLLGIRAHREVRRLLGGQSTQTGEKRKKKSYSNLHKNATHLSCCACAANAQAGGLQAVGHETCEDVTIMAII